MIDIDMTRSEHGSSAAQEREVQRPIATQSAAGELVAIEFDAEEGTLITIRVPSDTRWRAGTVRVEYIEN